MKSEYQETEITEAYKVEADPATGSTETKFEVRVQDAATAEAKVITFDENGEELNSSDAGSN